MPFNHIILTGLFLTLLSPTMTGAPKIETKTFITGKILDDFTKEPILGATIYIPELKTGTVSDAEGNFSIANLPFSKVLIQVTYVGYRMIAEYVDLATTQQKDFFMIATVSELNEVVVTGQVSAAEMFRTPAPITFISTNEILQSTSTNIIDAISIQPGLAQITTGAGISKPMIRGLGYNRVVTVIDGIRQEGQQWGDEHGIEADEYGISKVEILKGPASLSYGSDAMAGVINLLSAPPLPVGTIKGSILANYQTNNGLIGYSANLGGNQNGFIWNLRYSHKQAHAFRNKYDGYVLNSGFRENSVSATLGLNKHWGYGHLTGSYFHSTPGIVEGERDSATGLFIKPIITEDSLEGYGIAIKEDFTSYQPITPYQKVEHKKVVLNNSFILGKGSLKTTLGWQQNSRKEFSEILNPDQFGLFFQLNTINYDLRYVFSGRPDMKMTIGINGMHQSSANKGYEFLIPDYSLFDAGVYSVFTRSFERLDISVGARYDVRNQNGKDLYLYADGTIANPEDAGAFQYFKKFSSTYQGFSGTFGVSYQLSDQIFTKLNIARGYRAPNIAEISSNGVHEGTINYIIGVPSLKSENSFQIDFGMGLNTDHINGEISFFSNQISNFIYLSKLESTSGGDSITNGYSTFMYTSGEAALMGGEISFDIHPHPLDWLHFKNTFSYVISKQKNSPDSMQYLPFTPPAKWRSEIRASFDGESRYIKNGFLSISADNYFGQDKFYSAFGTETATPGYILLNAGIGFTLQSNTFPEFSLFLNANNILDVAYQSHLSRLKYGPVNHATGRIGVYNMGRNFSIKLVVPLHLK